MKSVAAAVIAVVSLATIAAVDAASNVVRYTYDAVGNIVAIARVDPAPVAITDFTPTSGPPGTEVTIAGSGFSTAPAANSVRFNGVNALVSAASTVALTVVVPGGAGKGKIEVAVGGSTATSAQDFVVTTASAPAIPGVAAGDILASASLAANGAAQSLGLYATNKYGLLLFDGKAGDWLSVHIADFAINPAGATIGYTIYRPDLAQLVSGTLSAANLSIHVPQLGVAGTYALLLSTGSAQVSLDARLDSNRFLPLDGPALAVERGAGQSTRALIAATTGVQSALMVSAMTTTPTGANLDWTIALPSGSLFRKTTAFGMGTTSPLPAFTTTGTHTITLMAVPASAQVAFKLALVGGIGLAIDGAATDVAIAGPGEGARLNFAAAAGESLGFALTRLALSPATQTSASFSVYKPDATLLTSGACRADGAQCSANLAQLPVSGNYSIVLQPSGGATATMQAWLSRDLVGSLNVGQPRAVALARPGQNARFTFAGTAGQALRLSWMGVTIPGTTSRALAIVYAPNGAVLATAQMASDVSGAYDLPALPLTGGYTLFVDPPINATMNATLTIAPR